jgi:hypothetical protein
MLFRTLAAAVVVAFFAVGSSPSPVKAGDAEVWLSAAPKQKTNRHVVRRTTSGQIACTVFGCHRIPARCHPETEFDRGGNSTDYDAVVCR